MNSRKIFEYTEVITLIVFLSYMGLQHFTSLSEPRIKQLQLEAGMEQLYLLEQSYYRESGKYFDPTDPKFGLNWSWMDNHEWEIRLGDALFRIVVSTDLNSDGRVGIWAMDQTSPMLTNLSDD
ncbi:MAG: hypothetical protein VX294_15435 [Candidatus Latescibacterota bacterium]|nr:hypothetical protein [Candidatus Latescibacterota bacterium]